MIGLALAVGLLGGVSWWIGDGRPSASAAQPHLTPGSEASAESAPATSTESQSTDSQAHGPSGLPSGTQSSDTSSQAGTASGSGTAPDPGTPGAPNPPKRTSPASHPSSATSQPSSGNSSSGRTNPYTAEQVCNSGSHGSGYYRQRSSTFSGGTVNQLYNSSGYNCVVTMKTAKVGTKSNVWAQLTSKDGTTAADNGSFQYYAGPVYVYARGQCVKYSGGAGSANVAAPWGNCG
jgi:hypothetical protein